VFARDDVIAGARKKLDPSLRFGMTIHKIGQLLLGVNNFAGF
jgi:hypothetical protein